jgi:hypothetical protein
MATRSGRNRVEASIRRYILRKKLSTNPECSVASHCSRCLTLSRPWRPPRPRERQAQLSAGVITNKKGRPETAFEVRLVEAATITSPYESIAGAAKRLKCPHRYPQITSPGILARFRQILSLFRRSPYVESLQRIGAADQGARSSKPPYFPLPLLVQVNPARGVRRRRRTPRVPLPPTKSSMMCAASPCRPAGPSGRRDPSWGRHRSAAPGCYGGDLFPDSRFRRPSIDGTLPLHQ